MLLVCYMLSFQEAYYAIVLEMRTLTKSLINVQNLRGISDAMVRIWHVYTRHKIQSCKPGVIDGISARHGL